MSKKLYQFKKLCDDYEQEIDEQDVIIEKLIEETKKLTEKKKVQRKNLPSINKLPN